MYRLTFGRATCTVCVLTLCAYKKCIYTIMYSRSTVWWERKLNFNEVFNLAKFHGCLHCDSKPQILEKVHGGVFFVNVHT